MLSGPRTRENARPLARVQTAHSQKPCTSNRIIVVQAHLSDRSALSWGARAPELVEASMDGVYLGDVSKLVCCASMYVLYTWAQRDRACACV